MTTLALLGVASTGGTPPGLGGGGNGDACAFSDDFDRANGALGAEWADGYTGSWTINTNQVVDVTGTSGDFISHDLGVGCGDCFAQASWEAGDNRYGVIIRNGGGAANSANADWYGGFTEVGRPRIAFYRCIDRVSGQLAWWDGAVNAGDVVKISAVGNAIKVYLNGDMKIDTTDATFDNTNTFVGFGRHDGGFGIWDNFEAGTAS